MGKGSSTRSRSLKICLEIGQLPRREDMVSWRGGGVNSVMSILPLLSTFTTKVEGWRSEKGLFCPTSTHQM